MLLCPCVLTVCSHRAGFGLAAQSTDYCRTLDPTGYVVLHQADVGEYLRTETSLN